MDGNFENIELQAFDPERRMSFNEFHELTGGDVAEFGKYIVNLPKIEIIESEEHIVRGEE